MHLVYPPKFCITILLDITVAPREIEDNGYAKFGGGGANKVYYGLSENCELQTFLAVSWLFVISWCHCVLKPRTDYDFTFCSPQTSSAIKIKDGYYSRGNLVICSTEMFISHEKTVNSRGWKFEEKRTYRIPRGSKPQGRQDFSDTYSYFSSIIDYVASYRWAISISDWQITIKCHLLLNTLE